MTYLPIILTVVAIAVLVLGLPHRRRFRQPEHFVLGLVFIAVGLVTFWLFQVLVVRFVRSAELRWVLHIVALVVSLSVFGGGLQELSRANNTARGDYPG